MSLGRINNGERVAVNVTPKKRRAKKESAIRQNPVKSMRASLRSASFIPAESGSAPTLKPDSFYWATYGGELEVIRTANNGKTAYLTGLEWPMNIERFTVLSHVPPPPNND